jgi:nitrite reductase/ring-hydroxylating ferredoxin subunit
MPAIRVCPVAAFPKDGRKAFNKQGRDIVIFQVDDKFYAVDRFCCHAGGDLFLGKVEGKTVICPVHQAVFDLETGDFVDNEYTSPALAQVMQPIQVHRTRIRNGFLDIEL